MLAEKLEKFSGDEDHRTGRWMITYKGQYHTPSLSKTVGVAVMTAAHVLCVKPLLFSGFFSPLSCLFLYHRTFLAVRHEALTLRRIRVVSRSTGQHIILTYPVRPLKGL